jgi:A/G-specific adenine glycosylase
LDVCFTLAPQKTRKFRAALILWYRKKGRDLPWRQTRDPYAILVSEFMLQQTQVATVLAYYQTWLRRFPNFAALARASETDALHAWQGLGYYTRARNLRKTAKRAMERHRGCFPDSIREMRLFPGIGKYTAHALATFAFDQPVPIVEANTARVLSRLFDLQLPIDSTAGRNKIWQQAATLAPKRSAAIYNSALLDLGALVCLPRKPKCCICPVKRFCRAKNPESLPNKRARPQVIRLVEKHAFVARGDKILLAKSAKRWHGMWILPPLNRSRQRDGAIYKAKFPFTNHRITLQVFDRPPRKIDNRQERWFRLRQLESIPLPSPHRRALMALLH